jgi:mannose/fructose/N-acetylgalactosamine-specific phosphotransferase system component IIC
LNLLAFGYRMTGVLECRSNDPEGIQMAVIGHTFIIVGFLLTMTFVGAIIGLPILAVGVALCFVSNMRKKRNSRPPEDDQETRTNF